MNEIWKIIDWSDGLYEVSNMGNVRSVDHVARNGRGTALYKGKILIKNYNLGGYLHVRMSVYGKTYTKLVHRLVSEAFIPNIMCKREVNHKDGVKDNNRVDNLEWCTSSENSIHAWDKGLQIAKVGDDCKLTRITNQQIDRIKEEYLLGTLQKDLANKYGCTQSYISRILSGVKRARG